MERRSFWLLSCVFFLLGALHESVLGFLNYPGGVNRYGDVLQAPARRVLLSDAPKTPDSDTALVAALDGTIYLLEVGSLKPLWSFSSGPHIYSSYQAPVNDKENACGIESNYFIDCGDDWELYAHNSLGKLKLMKSLEEYISSTPQIAENGGIVLGFKKTSAFLVDARTGRVIHAYRMSDPPSTTGSSFNEFPYNATVNKQYKSESNKKTDELPLYITRTDYTLMSFLPNSDKVLWNMTVAEIGAAFLCQDVDKSLSDTLSDESSESDLPYKMPLPCQSRALVFRFRNHNMLETLSLPLPTSTADVLPSQPNVEKVLELLPLPNSGGKLLDARDNKDLDAVLHSHAFSENCGISNMHDVGVLSDDGSLTLQRKFSTSQIILVFIALLVCFVYHNSVVSRAKALAVQATGTSYMNIHSKRKKSRKAGKGGSNDGKRDKEENEVQHTHIGNDNNFWMNLNQPISYSGDGRTIGKLVVSNEEIAKGSNGTIVLEGMYEGRQVAVKRLVRAYNDIALKEIQNLIMSDRHPNIVRWYGVEQDQDFVYLALERCSCSLYDLILMRKSPSCPTIGKNLDGEVTEECTVRLDSMEGLVQECDLWNSDGHPSPLLLKLLRDIISGLSHLHELGIVHRDLKPQNVLILNERSLCAKLSDMGISKCLVGDMSALSNHGTGSGSSGWQAPELLLHGQQTRAVDLFSLGCVLFYCMTGGRHPFGSRLERDINIVKSKVDLSLLDHIPEAVDLLLQLLNPNAKMRPKAIEVLNHPLFWSAEMRLSFLRDTSDRVELEDREAQSDLLTSLESIAPLALGARWNEKMDPLFLNNIGHYRRYRFHSVRDLLRVMRNKLNHYREIPAEIQELIGPVPEGFDWYFRSRFPKLLIEVYKVMITFCSKDEGFAKYFNGSGL